MGRSGRAKGGPAEEGGGWGPREGASKGGKGQKGEEAGGVKESRKGEGGGGGAGKQHLEHQEVDGLAGQVRQNLRAAAPLPDGNNQV